MLQGKTKIELFETRPGGGYFKVEDSNMVTNAIANLVNPPIEMIRTRSNKRYGQSFPLLSHCLSPLTTVALQGIMLFDGTISEDGNNIIPDVSSLNQIGCASQDASSVRPYRGVLNATETKDLENGRRYVWDFATDKANGIIRSVCLTSPVAGYCGVDNGRNTIDKSQRFRAFDGSDINGIQPLFQSLSRNPRVSTDTVICSGTNAFVYPIGSFENNTFLFLKPVIGGSTSYTFQKCVINPSFVGLRNSITETRTEITVSTAGAKLSLFPIADDNYIYSFFKTATDSFDFVKIDAKTLRIVEEKNVCVQDAVFNQNTGGLQGIELGGYYYVCNGYNSNISESTKHIFYYASSIYKINTQDYSDYLHIDLIKEGIVNNNGEYAYLQKYKNMLTVTSRETYVINSDSIKKCNHSHTSDVGEFILPSPWLKEPFVIATAWDAYRLLLNRICFGFDTCYMATINNLSTPVVKNETQTMKVTYEITEI